MPKRLEWSARAAHDREHIVRYYAETASPHVAEMAQEAIFNAVENLATRPVLHRPGK